MIIGIEGGLGSGKTLMMARYLYQDLLNGFDVRANFRLNFKSNDLDVKELLETGKELKDVTIGLDEITVFIDCRKSMSKMNRLISYFILQSRKRNVNIYYTTQDFDMVDKRLIQHTHIQIIAEKIYYSDGREIPDYRRYTILDFRNPKNLKPIQFIVDISKYYNLYDTDEIIKPPI
jgi:cytidylate kinase